MNHLDYISLEIPKKTWWFLQTNYVVLLFHGRDYSAPATLICTLLGTAGTCHKTVLASGEQGCQPGLLFSTTMHPMQGSTILFLLPLGSQLKHLLPTIAVSMLHQGLPYPIQEKSFMVLELETLVKWQSLFQKFKVSNPDIEL